MMQVIKLASSCTVGVCLITIIIIRMMEVIKLASSTEFATKIRKVSNFCTEVIHFKLEALQEKRDMLELVCACRLLE